MRIQSSFESASPRLYVCSTPIGNLEDATLRLIQTLREVEVIAAEDTRHTRKLLTHFDIQPQHFISYHQHNWRSRSDSLVRWWAEGKSIALVTDAGTPGVSDPGAEAVALAIEHSIPVVPIPGASAVLSALVASGLPMQPFAFVGFLPRNRKSALSIVSGLQSFPGTLVLYEAPHRLDKTLSWLAEWLPDRAAALAKELTKRHEAVISGTIQEVAEYVRTNESRGEYVVVLGPPSQSVDEAVEEERVKADQMSMEEAVQAVYEAIGRGVSHTEAVRRISEQTGIRRKTLYQATLIGDPFKQ